MKNNEKTEGLLRKIFTIVVIILIVLAINTIILLVNGSNSSTLKGSDTSGNNNESQVVDGYDVSKMKEVTGSEIASNTKGKNTVVYIGRSSCSWCVKFVPILNQAIDKYDLDVLYVDIAKIIDFSAGGVKDQKNYDAITKLDTVSELDGYMEENFGATPMTLIIKDGKIVAAETGYMESSALNSYLEKNGFK